MFFIDAKLSIAVQNISGPFLASRTKIVHAGSIKEAQNKFEKDAYSFYSHMGNIKIHFEYIKIADELH